MEDTIAAISTALGVGAISIIRVSGSDSISIIDKIFDKDLTKAKTHTIHYGHIIDNNQIIDEVLISVMLAPKTFTTEDVVEINCHGGISTTKKILELVLTHGARLAEPGEFTKRAFLNGRIDLTQAEGIMNLIESKSEISRNLSINQLTGSVSTLIKSLRSDLADILSNIAVNIDYPEYEDIEVLTSEKIIPNIQKLLTKINDIINKSEDGKIITEGINIGIIGRPNVGKSSLLNALLEEQKAIVTDIEGTTRDIVEGTFTLNGILCHIIDTAGIRKTDNLVEKIGVDKSYQIIDKSDLIIYILNNNEPLTEEDKTLLSKIKNKNHLIIINKIDLESKLNLSNEDTIKMSIKENIGLEELKTKIIEMFNLEKIETNDLTYLTDARSISLLKKSKKILENCLQNISTYPVDVIELDLKECWTTLGEIIGQTYKDELIDEIFSRFCLGK
ncbi:MAG: tRNA uridine-5-carboxymethylaminomethyl(34) synthesis GTPase MnmE [Bacilli bacterium]